MERWYLLFTKPHAEDRVRAELECKGLTTYLPTYSTHSGTVGGGASVRLRPLFPRYLFVRIDVERMNLNTLRWTPGLSDVVSFGGDLAVVDDSVIAYLRERARDLQIIAQQPFCRGQRVCLRPGHPLAALDAVFENNLSDGTRARILIEMLGRLTRCEVNLEDLQPVSNLL